MKKSLVLAMAMALGVTASSYAANPFSDVPQGHWAYASIQKLADNGIIEGYGDTTFGGDRLMTRYEMSQIVAKAMAKGANVDKLAAEFADDLNLLGVRVANLERKSDNVKITGQIRASYKDVDGKWIEMLEPVPVDGLNAPTEGPFVGVAKSKAHSAALRTRLWVNGTINDDWAYTGMLQNEQIFSDESGNDTIELKRAYLDGKIGGTAFRGGRWDEVTFTGNVLDSYLDGAKFTYGDKVKVFGLTGKGASEGYLAESNSRIYVVGVEADFGAVDAYAGYFKTDDSTDTNIGAPPFVIPVPGKAIWNIGASYGFNDFVFAAEYMRGNKNYMDYGKDGWAADLAWKGADAATPGSYGLHIGYFDQSRNAYISPTTDAWTFRDGYKGFAVGGSYAFAKNIVGVVNYYDMESPNYDQDAKTIFSELYFTF